MSSAYTPSSEEPRLLEYNCSLLLCRGGLINALPELLGVQETTYAKCPAEMVPNKYFNFIPLSFKIVLLKPTDYYLKESSEAEMITRSSTPLSDKKIKTKEKHTVLIILKHHYKELKGLKMGVYKPATA